MRLILAALLVLAPMAHARDLAVLVYPKERSLFRRVFYTSHQDALIESIRERYDTEVHEQIATDDELFAIDVDGAKLLVLSAHGDPFAMYFANRNERSLDSTDAKRLEEFLDRLDPDATIVLQSCHTGRGFAHLVKEAAGSRNVIAAKGEIPWNGLTIESTEPFEVTIRCDDGGRRWDCTLRLRDH
jgi:hypothetical protein